MGKEYEQILFHRRYAGGQQVQEKMLDVSYQGNGRPTTSRRPFKTTRMVIKKQVSAGEDMRKGKFSCISAAGNAK